MIQRSTRSMIGISSVWGRCCICILLGMTFTTTRTEAADAKDTTEKLDSIGPFCGTYCVYAAAKRLGKEVDVLQLTTPELVYSHKGSTLVDLQAAADRVGLHSKIVSNWSAADLKP